MNNISSIHSRILDPVFDRKNNRVEFRFPSNSLFQSDLRLINIGITSSDADDSPNPLLGLLGAIKSVRLLDGSTQLDQLTQANIYNAFLNARKSNDVNRSTRQLNYQEIGYTTSGNETLDSNQQVLKTNPKINTQSEETYATNAIDSKRCWISLKEMLPFLRNSIVLPTNIFKQLRLVIEYNSSAELKYMTKKTGATKNTTEDSLLLVEEIGDGDFKEQAMKQYKGVVFRPIEHEQVSVPAVSGLADSDGSRVIKQENNYLLTGANNKKLIKMLVVQSPTDTATLENGGSTIGYSSVGSYAQYQSEVQVRVNGSNVLAGQGMSPSSTGSFGNRRTAYLNDSWGINNVVLGQNVPALNSYSDLVQHSDRQGQQDYIGLLVDSHIQELQLHYNRSGVVGANNLPQNQALNLNIFYEVEKALLMNKDGSYNVIYTQ